jgi:alpha-tubulin suppressor-like RCC1 family protein
MSQTNVLFWGNNQHSLLSPLPNKTFPRPSQASIPYQVVDLAASEKHIAFVTQDGSLYTYGLNLDGRLGIGGKPDARFSISNPAKVKLSAPVFKVKCGFSHTCVQLINQELYAWGLGDYGALGTGEFKSRGTPGKVQVKGKISNFSCGAMHSGFIDSEGNIFTCGSNEYGELGVNRPEKIATPILVSFSQKAKQI